MVKSNKIVFFVITIGLLSCNTQQAAKRYSVKNILGEWRLNDNTQINYPSLEFNTDSTAIFTSKADTIYRWKYLLQGDTLLLFDVYNTKKEARIIQLDSLTLAFDGLLEKKGKQQYFRVK